MKKLLPKIFVLLLLCSFCTELGIDIFKADKAAYTITDIQEQGKEEKKEKDENEKDKLLPYFIPQLFTENYKADFASYTETPVTAFTAMPEIPPKQACYFLF